MSELNIKRQAYRNSIRREQIEAYIATKRQQLIPNYPSHAPPLTDQELDRLYNHLEDTHYSTDSLLAFIRVIEERSTASLDKPVLFVRLRRILGYIEEREQFQLARKMIKQICLRVASEAVTHPSFFQSIFREFLQLIGIHNYELHQVWPSVGLIRNQLFFDSSFQWFLDYVQSYPCDIKDIIEQILLSFAHFTTEIQQQPKLTLKSAHLLAIVDSIHKIMEYYCLDQKDMNYAALAISNIVKMYPVDQGLKVVQIETLLPQFISYLDTLGKQQTLNNSTTTTISSVFDLIGLCFAGSEKTSSQIILKNRNLLQVICRLLPIKSPFKKVKIPRPVQWTHQNVTIVIGVLFILANIAAFENSHPQLISSGTLGLVIELSAFESSRVQEEIGIFLWNMVVPGREEMVQLLCDNDILYALCKIITAEYSNSTVSYGLRCLLKVILTANTLPANSNHWHFPLIRIKNILVNSNAYSVLEHLSISLNQQIAKRAISCLDILQ